MGGEEHGELTFCLAGPRGDAARKLLGPRAKLIRTVEAGGRREAMTACRKFTGRGEYTTDQEWDVRPYPKDWSEE